jgi:hypothetical protein
MKNSAEATFHFVFALLWIGGAIYLAIAIAVASGEKTALERRRGADFKERRELAAQQEHLRTQIDWLASAPSIEEAVARLGLPITPPNRIASR